MDLFFTRQGYSRPDAEISIRHEAPEALRVAVVSVTYQFGFESSELCRVLCSILYKTPNKSNWSEYPDIDYEVGNLMDNPS